MFGRGRLVSTPAHSARELATGAVALKLVPTLRDTNEAYEVLKEAREKCKDHEEKANSGIYVNGTVDSLSFDQGGNLNYGYTDENGNIGVGTVVGVTPPNKARWIAVP
jgi:hypothetical protein